VRTRGTNSVARRRVQPANCEVQAPARAWALRIEPETGPFPWSVSLRLLTTTQQLRDERTFDAAARTDVVASGLVSLDQLHAMPGRSHSGVVLQNESRERCSATHRYARSSSRRIDGTRYVCAIQDQGRPSSVRTRLTAAAPLNKAPLESTAQSSRSVCVRVRPYCSTRPGV